MPVNSQSMGRILSVQKIIVAGTEQTPEGAVTDGKVTQYMLIRGSTGNDAIVDSNGNLVCMLKGSENIPIAQEPTTGELISIMRGSQGIDVAQDASGNMVAVMKGNYAGALKTWKVDDEGRGEMFITDPSDVWGNAVSVGLCEAVNRLGAHSVYDRRGSIYWEDDCESSTLKWATSVVGAGSSVARSNDIAFRDDYSYKFIADSTLNDYALLRKRFDALFSTRYGFELSFSPIDGINASYSVMIKSEFFTGTQLKTSAVRYNGDNGEIEYYDSAGAWQTIDNVAALQYNYFPWYHMKYVVDFSNDKYTRFLFHNTEYDLSTYSIQTAASAASPNHRISIEVQTMFGGNTHTVYIDNFRITLNEPA